tara:strand:+ start:1868 stop:2122 length:255 start_codon:yes stop_codon:yes gene_type:complete
MNTSRYMVISAYDYKVVDVFTRYTGISTNWIGVGTQGKLWKFPFDDVELYPGAYIARASNSVGIGKTYKIDISTTVQFDITQLL